MSAFSRETVRANSRIMPPSQATAAAILRRIDRRLKALDLTDNAASAAATGSRDTIRTIRRNVADGSQRGISTETLRKLATALKTTDEWLLHERGPEEVDVAAAPDDSQPSSRRERIARIPLLSWVSAGRLASVENQIPVEDVPLLAFADLGRGDFFALRVEGDSMDRISPDSSVIVVNRANRQLVNGKAYVFAIRGETTFKLWHAEPEYLAPHSTNPANQPIFFKRKKDLEVVGRVRRSVLDL